MSANITIYTDASFCPRTKAGGWGAWIKYGNNETMTLSSYFKNTVGCSTEAEMMAIANAIWLIKRKIDTKGKTLVVVTDSQCSIEYITKGVGNMRDKRKRQNFISLAGQINQMIDADMRLIINKVKAHSSNDGKRSYVNGIVDSSAKSAMYKKRKLLAKERKGSDA